MHASHGRHAAWFVDGKATLGVLVTLTLLGAAGLAAWFSLQQLGATESHVESAHAALGALDALQTALFDIEANERSYQLSGDPAYLEACRAALPRAEDAVRSLRALTGENPDQQERLGVLDPLVERRLALVRAALAHPNGQVRPAVERPFRDENKPLLDETRSVVRALRTRELTILSEWSGRAETATALLGLTTTAALALTAAASVGALLLISRTARLRQAAEDALRHRDDADRRREQEAAADAVERRALEAEVRRAQKLEAVGRLAGGIAHDFNNLLTVINGCCDLLMLRRPLDDPQRELLDAVHGAAERAAALTRQLLAFGRRRIVQPRVVDLNTVVGDIGKLLARLIGEDITLDLALEPGVAPVRGDQAQLEQVVMNLALNARDAMPQGGRLEIRTQRVELGVSFATAHLEAMPGPYILLTVRDTGMGMDANVRAHLFEPFFTTKGPGKGTGLGLATVYTAVKEAGGAIDFITAAGQGTTVHVYLPRAEAVEPAEQSPGRPRAQGGAETILVVEDEPGVRLLISEMLRSRGYTVLDASNGVDALRTAAAHDGPIHLLVTDVVMPHLSGRVLAEHLAALRPNLKVLYLSGYTDDAMVRHGIEQGAAFLHKPFTPEALAAQVRAVLASPSPP
jgi:signal transduction histidine kinase